MVNVSVSEAERETSNDATVTSSADTDETSPAPHPPVDGLAGADRRRLRRAWLAGAVPTLVGYAWVLTAGRWDFLQRQFFDYFFDVQARAMLHGRLEVPAESVGFEGFVTDGRTYIYFGVVPSLLRMPVLALTDNLDGRLTTVSMLLASVVLTVATFRLACVVRAMVRGSVPVGRVEQGATAGLAVATLLAPPFFLTSAAIVYHEATLWALALSVAGFDAVARWQRDPSGRRLAVASALVSLAILSRFSIALGPLAALALAGALHLWDRWRKRDAEQAEPGRSVVVVRLRRLLPAAAGVAVAGLVPLGLSAAVNYAKFQMPFGVPIDRQAHAMDTGNRRAVLEEHPSYTSLEYLPTNLWQYLGPNGLELRRDFPWIDFPRNGPTVLGDGVIYDALDWCSSLPFTVPALCLLAAGGLVWSVRSRRGRDAASRVSPVLVGALVGSSIVMVFPYIANRYLNDFYPLALVPGLVGFHAAARLAPRWDSTRKRATFGFVGALVVVGAMVNLALALEYQRERGPAVPDDWRAEWVGLRAAAPGSPEPLTVGLDDSLPRARDGALVVVGDCDGLYVGVRDIWRPVERGPEVGVHDVRLDVSDLPMGERVPIVTLGRGEGATVVAVVRLKEDMARVDVLGPQSVGRGWQEYEPQRLQGEVMLRIAADRRALANDVHWDNVAIAAVPRPVGDGADDVELGDGVERLAPDMSTCESLTTRD